MVYCGRPSKSCRQCRNRNVKCDKKAPSCGQCQRTHFQCPGYHNPTNLIFRNETRSIIQKNVNTNSNPTMKPNSIKPPNSSFTSKSSIPSPIVPPLEQRAKDLFVSRNVYGIGGAPVFDYLHAFWPHPDSCLEITFRAVSLAFLTNELGPSFDAMELARRRYSSALLMTKEALRSKSGFGEGEGQREDSMLATVLLLDLFEKLTRGIQDSVSETRHLEGAMALVQLRSEEQFSSPIRLRMFLKLTMLIMQSYLQRKIPPPSDFMALRDKSRMYVVNASDPKWRWEELLAGIVRLRGDMRKGVGKMEVLERVREMEREWAEVGGIMCCLDGVRKAVLLDGDEDWNYGRISLRNSLRLVKGFLDEILQECEGRMFDNDADLDAKTQAIPEIPC